MKSLLKSVKIELDYLPYKVPCRLTEEAVETLASSPCSVCTARTARNNFGRKNIGTLHWKLSLQPSNVFALCARCWNIRAGQTPANLIKQCLAIDKFLRNKDQRRVLLQVNSVGRTTAAQSRDMRRRELKKCGEEASRVTTSYPGLVCYYCGNADRVGVDRLDNDACPSYVTQNTVPCCTLCNKMKHVLPKPLFLDAVQNVALNHNR